MNAAGDEVPALVALQRANVQLTFAAIRAAYDGMPEGPVRDDLLEAVERVLDARLLASLELEQLLGRPLEHGERVAFLGARP